jgi:hypothetical protein
MQRKRKGEIMEAQKTSRVELAAKVIGIATVAITAIVCAVAYVAYGLEAAGFALAMTGIVVMCAFVTIIGLGMLAVLVTLFLGSTGNL